MSRMLTAPNLTGVAGIVLILEGTVMIRSLLGSAEHRWQHSLYGGDYVLLLEGVQYMVPSLYKGVLYGATHD